MAIACQHRTLEVGRILSHPAPRLAYNSSKLHASRLFWPSAVFRLATSVCRPRHDQMGQGPTEPHAGRSTFLLSSGGAGGRVLLSGL